MKKSKAVALLTRDYLPFMRPKGSKHAFKLLRRFDKLAQDYGVRGGLHPEHRAAIEAAYPACKQEMFDLLARLTGARMTDEQIRALKRLHRK